MIEKNSGISSRSGAAKLKISKSYFNKIKVHKLGIKAFRKRIAPDSTEEQEIRARKNCRKLYERLTSEKLFLLMDDETYVPEDPKLVPGPEYYHAKNKNDVPVENRIKNKKKFIQSFKNLASD